MLQERVSTMLSSPLTGRELAVMALQGVVFWLGFAIFVRALEPFGLLQGGAKVAMFVVAVPLTVALMAGIRTAMGYSAARMVEVIGIITGVAIMLDGLAFGFFPQLYGREVAHQVAGAGLILWGGGVGMMVALVMQRRAGG
jgi:hypothetical protein